MVTKELVDYIKDEINAKKNIDDITSTLLNTGWTKQDVDGALEQVQFQLKLERPTTSAAVNTGAAPPTGSQDSDPKVYPNIFIPIPTSPNRLWAIPIFGGLVKIIILIPVYLELIVVSLASSILIAFANPFVVLFTGKYLQIAYDLYMFVLRLDAKVLFFSWGLTDTYPGFTSTLPKEITLDIALPQNPSKLFAIPLLGGIARFILLLPFSIFSYVIQQAASWGSVFASFPVLIMGKYPESIYEIVLDQARLTFASGVYSSGLSDKYPSFRISWNHKKIKIMLIILGVISGILLQSTRFIAPMLSNNPQPPAVVSPSPYPSSSPTSISPQEIASPTVQQPSVTPRVLLK